VITSLNEFGYKNFRFLKRFSLPKCLEQFKKRLLAELLIKIIILCSGITFVGLVLSFSAVAQMRSCLL
jgi:hypothetical protein